MSVAIFYFLMRTLIQFAAEIVPQVSSANHGGKLLVRVVSPGAPVVTDSTSTPAGLEIVALDG